MENEESKLPAVRSIAWLDRWGPTAEDKVSDYRGNEDDRQRPKRRDERNNER
jgi:hypothetical protein